MASVLLVEPYYGGSHKAWVDSWTTSSRHKIGAVTHPDRFWRWRLRGAAVTLADEIATHVEQHGRPDAVVISSMVDGAALLGLTRRSLGPVPSALYMHESQLLYPPAPGRSLDTDAALANWRSMTAVDAVWFNSEFHRRALLHALPDFLNRQPEPGHSIHIDRAFTHSEVLWPAVSSADLIAGRRSERSVPRVLWNQRWDHDKNPNEVFRSLADAAEQGAEFTLALAGENQGRSGTDFLWLEECLGDRIDHRGFLEPASYRELLLSSDVVISAADHEFFGIALVEAIAAGAVPVLPNRLSFPELILERWHDQVLYVEGELGERVRDVLTGWPRARHAIDGLRATMDRFDAASAAVAHDRAVDDLLARFGPQ